MKYNIPNDSTKKPRSGRVLRVNSDLTGACAVETATLGTPESYGITPVVGKRIPAKNLTLAANELSVGSFGGDALIQLIGLIVAAYAIARLCQVPFEASAVNKNTAAVVLIGVVSAVGLIAIGVLTLSLLSAGLEMPHPGTR